MFEMTTVVEWAAALGTISAACGINVRAVTKDVVNSVQAVGEKHDAYAKAAGEKYEDLPKSYDERAQGYFMDQRFLTHCMLVRSFKSRADYRKAFKKYAGWL